MQAADQTVISLRPGGGGGGPRGTRLFTHRFDSSSTPSSDSQTLPSHGGVASAFKVPTQNPSFKCLHMLKIQFSESGLFQNLIFFIFAHNNV